MVKLAIWSYAAAVCCAGLGVALTGAMIRFYFHDEFYGQPLPGLIEFYIRFHWWALAVSLPWLVAAVWLSRRDAATQSRAFAYAGVSTFAIVCLFMFTAFVLALPYVPIGDLRGLKNPPPNHHFEPGPP